MLHLNFDQEGRATAFFHQRVAQGNTGTTLKTFEVPSSFVDALRSFAVPQRVAADFPNAPQIVDATRAPDQFGLRLAQIEQLRKVIVPNSGKVVKVQ
jgi:hypothetical protein